MNGEMAVRRSQVYGFLSAAFLYPEENWSEDVALLSAVLAGLGPGFDCLQVRPSPLADLQAGYRRVFGATGSLCYETEYGLPHEFRQSQELADISGFYRAFGFTTGGPVSERPDHLAVELEFMHVLTLKECYAASAGCAEAGAVCVEAQKRFLQDHLGRWVDLFARSLTLNSEEGSPYEALARFMAAFVQADAARLGAQPAESTGQEVQHTPFDPNFSCSTCPVAEMVA